MADTARELVERLYDALARGDEPGVRAVVADDVDAVLADGMPHGIGGAHRGADAQIRDGWWAIGRHYAVRAEPDEYVACEDGRLLVCGRYRGRARADGAPVDAAFTHLWTIRDGRIAALRQVTDTARWSA